MKNLFRIATVLMVGSLLVTGAFAQGKKPMMAKKATHKMAKAMACPVCKMPLSMKKTKASPVAVHVGKKTMYCCAACTMPKALMGPAVAMHKKPMMKKKGK
jgi:uncharacterized protein YbaR (Trm112 family)